MKIDEDTLIAYTLGTLTPEAEQEVARYLEAHPEEAASVRDNFEALTAVVLSQEPEALPDDAEEALLARIRDRDPLDDYAVGEAQSAPPTPAEPEVLTLPTTRRQSWWFGLAAAAALAGLLWFGLLQPRYQNYLVEQQLETACAQTGAVCQVLENEQGEPLGTLAKLENNELLVVFDEPPPSGRVYQGWEIAGGTAVPLETSGERVLEIRASLDPESLFGGTLEPPGGSARPTSQPIVVVPL